MKWRSLEESSLHTETRSLREIFAERKALIAQYVPAETQAVHDRVVSELQESRIAQRALQPGNPAPEFELPDQNGKPVRSADLLNAAPLVICFIRGRWDPFCVGQMEAMNAIVPDLQKLEANLVAISPQTVHHNYLMSDQHKLQFPLLSDSGNQVARQFGIVYRVPDYQQEVYKRVFVNLPFTNGDHSWELPIPATFITGRRGGSERPENQQVTKTESISSESEILYASASPDYTDRPEPADLLAFLAHFSF